MRVRKSPVVLDPTAGGGSVPFEAVRLGFEAISNDLNPVATLIERATIQYPLAYGMALVAEFNRLAAKLVERREAALKSIFSSRTGSLMRFLQILSGRGRYRCPLLRRPCASVAKLASSHLVGSACG